MNNVEEMRQERNNLIKAVSVYGRLKSAFDKEAQKKAKKMMGYTSYNRFEYHLEGETIGAIEITEYGMNDPQYCVEAFDGEGYFAPLGKEEIDEAKQFVKDLQEAGYHVDFDGDKDNGLGLYEIKF